MSEVAVAFMAIAALTFVGFGASRFFERTRFPDILLLLGLGLLVGPGNRWAAERGWGSTAMADVLGPDNLHAIAPYMAALALVVLLFDSGLQLDFLQFRRSLAPAAIHTIPIYVLTVLGVALAGKAVFDMPWSVGLVLGVAFTSVDQAVSAGVLKHLRIGEAERSIYFVEMAFYDLLSIPIIIAILAGAQGIDATTGAGGLLRSVASLVSVSIAMGLAAGIPWVFALTRLHRGHYSYMLTFALTLAVYGATELLGGSGAISILLFGLIVGNREAFLRKFARQRVVDPEHTRVQTFHDEISFFVRTLFFLYLGLSFTVGEASQWPVASTVPGLSLLGPGPLFAVATVLMAGVLIGARWLGIRIGGRDRQSRAQLFPVFGRGLDTAVLVTLPFLAAGYVPGTPYHDLFMPWEGVFVNMALLVILLTVLTSSILVFVSERRLGPVPAAAPPHAPGAASGGAPARAGALPGPARPAARGDEVAIPLRAGGPAAQPRAKPAARAPEKPVRKPR